MLLKMRASKYFWKKDNLLGAALEDPSLCQEKSLWSVKVTFCMCWPASVMLDRSVEIPMALISYKFHKNWSPGGWEGRHSTVCKGRQRRVRYSVSWWASQKLRAELSWAVGTLSPVPSQPRHTLPLGPLSTQPKRAQGHKRHSRS